MSVRGVAILAVAVFSLACDPPGEAPGPDGGGGDLETYLRENAVTRLTLQADGTEYGDAVTDAGGVARFYSTAHEMLFDMSTVERGLDAPLAGRRVHIAVAGTSAAYLITDPSGHDAPFLYTVALPGRDTEVTVDAYDETQLTSEPPFDPAVEENPFGAARAPLVGARTESLIVGIAVTFAIRTVLTGMAVSAVAAVFRYLVDGACNVVAPLYAERCALISGLAGTAVELIGGFRTGASAWELGATAIDGALTATDLHCDHLGATMMGYVTDPSDQSALTRYRELARRFNYLLHQMETDPQPGQPTWAQMRLMAQALIDLRNVVRNDYFQLWNQESFGDRVSVGYGIGVASDSIGEAFNGLGLEIQELVLTQLEITEVVRWYLEIGPRSSTFSIESHRYTRATFEAMTFPVEVSDGGAAVTGLFFDCAANFVQGALVSYYDDAAARRVSEELTTGAIVGGQLEVLERAVDAIYLAHWGEVIPPGMCLPDEYEPNARWQDAVASPVPVELASGSVVDLPDLNQCDAIGMSGADDDWYAYYIGPIEFRVQSRIMGVAGGVGQDEPVCLDVYFYSEIYEIAGTPPDIITGICGRVSDMPATDSFGVRRTIGERWSMILLRVHPGPGATGAPIDYGLRFLP